jgi:hypothetical protein
LTKAGPIFIVTVSSSKTFAIIGICCNLTDI